MAVTKRTRFEVLKRDRCSLDPLKVERLMARHASRHVSAQVRGERPIVTPHLVRVSVVVRPMLCTFPAGADVVASPASVATESLVHRRVGRDSGPVPIGLTWTGRGRQNDLRTPVTPNSGLMHGAHRRAIHSQAIAPRDSARVTFVAPLLRLGCSDRFASVEPVVVGLAQALRLVLERPLTAFDSAFHVTTIAVCRDCNSEAGEGNGA